MEERRKFVRLSSQLKASYTVLGAEEPVGSLMRNVGGGGISLFTKKRMAPGTILGIEVFFPSRVAPVRFTVEVIWSGELIRSDSDDRPPIFETGARFLDISPENREFILHYAGSNLLKNQQLQP